MLDAGMVAPPEPTSADALTFTFVRPFAGACTMTCVSTVSPRALDSVMADVVPGASSCRTLIKPEDTHKGKGALDDWPTVMKIARPTSAVAASVRLLAFRRVQGA